MPADLIKAQGDFPFKMFTEVELLIFAQTMYKYELQVSSNSNSTPL